MKVVITDNAWSDLLHIGGYIKSFNPSRASTFIDEIYERCQRLQHMPRAFPLLPGREDSGIRRRPFGDYLIFYRIKNETVEILHILNGAQDYEQILFPDG